MRVSRCGNENSDGAKCKAQEWILPCAWFGIKSRRADWSPSHKPMILRRCRRRPLCLKTLELLGLPSFSFYPQRRLARFRLGFSHLEGKSYYDWHHLSRGWNVRKLTTWLEIGTRKQGASKRVRNAIVFRTVICEQQKQKYGLISQRGRTLVRSFNLFLTQCWPRYRTVAQGQDVPHSTG